MLVLHGEAGVGKTALIENIVGSVSGFRVTRVVGMEAEMELPFRGTSPAMFAAPWSARSASGTPARRTRDGVWPVGGNRT